MHKQNQISFKSLNTFFAGSVPHSKVLVNFLLSGMSFLDRDETNQQKRMEGLILLFLTALLHCR